LDKFSGVITATGDIVAQKLEKSSNGHNVRRTAIMSTFGFCYFVSRVQMVIYQ